MLWTLKQSPEFTQRGVFVCLCVVCVFAYRLIMAETDDDEVFLSFFEEVNLHFHTFFSLGFIGETCSNSETLRLPAS